jgi:hypothetical protein
VVAGGQPKYSSIIYSRERARARSRIIFERVPFNLITLSHQVALFQLLTVTTSYCAGFDAEVIAPEDA